MDRNAPQQFAMQNSKRNEAKTWTWRRNGPKLVASRRNLPSRRTQRTRRLWLDIFDHFCMSMIHTMMGEDRVRQQGCESDNTNVRVRQHESDNADARVGQQQRASQMTDTRESDASQMQTTMKERKEEHGINKACRTAVPLSLALRKTRQRANRAKRKWLWSAQGLVCCWLDDKPSSEQKYLVGFGFVRRLCLVKGHVRTLSHLLFLSPKGGNF